MYIVIVFFTYELFEIYAEGTLGSFTFNASFMAIWFTWILGAGLIGRDVSTGTLHLLLTRPIIRYRYVLVKWFALSFLATTICWLNFFLGIGIIRIFQGESIVTHVLLGEMINVLIYSFGTASLVAAFSSLLPGHGDLGLWFSLFLIFQGAIQLLIYLKIYATMFVKVGLEILLPGYNFVDYNSGKLSEILAKWSGFDMYLFGLAWLAIMLVYLSLACWALNRKELSYGSH
ncbi:MAG: ABC transporter permease subunit [Deltaproteobacteria bacterium]|nr:ABC transporter permease subunit [Deltaproteobacteria bacterium]